VPDVRVRFVPGSCSGSGSNAEPSAPDQNRNRKRTRNLVPNRERISWSTSPLVARRCRQPRVLDRHAHEKWIEALPRMAREAKQVVDGSPRSSSPIAGRARPRLRLRDKVLAIARTPRNKLRRTIRRAPASGPRRRAIIASPRKPSRRCPGRSSDASRFPVCRMARAATTGNAVHLLPQNPVRQAAAQLSAAALARTLPVHPRRHVVDSMTKQHGGRAAPTTAHPQGGLPGVRRFQHRANEAFRDTARPSNSTALRR